MVGEGSGGPELIQTDPPLATDVKSPAARAKKTKEGEPGLDLTHQDTWGRYLTLAFDGLAALTGHEHWEKSEPEIELVAIPAARIAREQIPKELLEKAQRGQNWVALWVGIAVLILPSLIAEWRLWRERGTVARSVSPPPRAEHAPPAATNVVGSNGAIPETNPRGPLCDF